MTDYISIELSPQEAYTYVVKARKYRNFRNRCKTYLKERGHDYDKFTITDNDSTLGYISETIVSEYIEKTYNNVKVQKWIRFFDFYRVKKILDSGSNDEEDIEYVKNYFYDRYDLEVTVGNNRPIYIDVKTAITKLQPTAEWNFLYPCVQAHKKGKDYSILAYCIANDKDNIETLKNIIIIGFIKEEDIKKNEIIEKGVETEHGTISQIKNYDTHITQYKDINELFKK